MREDTRFEPLNFKPLEVRAEDCYSIDDMIRKFKQEVQKDGLLLKLKEKSAYEKPSDRKRRVKRESIRRLMMEELKEKQILSGEWDKKMKEKEEKRREKYGAEDHEE